jgi:myxalamid-type nonribosomal peptide synthetase MxaA
MINELLLILKNKNIDLQLVNDQLKLTAPEGAVSSEIFELIKKHKPELIKLLKDSNNTDGLGADEVHDNRYLSLSSNQRSMWLLHKLNVENFHAYNEPLLFTLTGIIDINRLNVAVNTLIERHATLRTVFVEEHLGTLYRNILSKVEINIASEKTNLEDVDRIIQEEISIPFNLSHCPLFRIRLFDTGSGQYQLLFVFHHIIIDGASLRIFCDELSEIYNKGVKDRHRESDAPPAAHIDHAIIQQGLICTEAYNKKLNYWKNTLRGYQELDLAFNKKRKNVFSYNGAKYTFNLGKDLSKRISSLAGQKRTTLFNIMLANFTILLSKYCRQEDIMVGAPMENRTKADFTKHIGFFSNTVVLRNIVNSDLSFTQFLTNVTNNTFAAYGYQEVAFEHVVENLNVPRGANRNPMVQALIVVVNESTHPILTLDNISSEPVRNIDNKTAKFDLTLVVYEEKDTLTISIEYATDLFDEPTIQLFSQHFESMLQQIVSTPDSKIKDISIIDMEDKRKLLLDWNMNYTHYPCTKTLSQLFSEVALTRGKSIAVKYNSEYLSYEDLDFRSNKLARHIRAVYQNLYDSPMRKNTLISVCLDKSLNAIVTILAVLKSGAAYVPIDIKFPGERIKHIIDDSNAQLLITEESIFQNTSELHELDRNRIIFLDDEAAINQVNSQPSSPLEISVSPEDLAYVIYTSGSTGKPKGVLIPHSNVLRLFSAATEKYDFNENDIWSFFHSYAFDFSVWEIWGALLFGGKLIVIPHEKSKDTNAFYQLTKDEGITVLCQTPSAFRNYIDIDTLKPDRIQTLRYVIFGGEALNIEILRDWWDHHSDTSPQLVNMYGITETTIHATYQELRKSDLNANRQGFIGKPLNNLRMLVLDEQQELCPVGVPGELCVAGDALAHGYLNKEQLTRERFIDNPYCESMGLPRMEKLYRSGDIVRWSADGNLEYIGRSDFQIKLRGFRIELGEIEATLSRHHLIKQCVVTLHEGANTSYLVGYYTLVSGNQEADSNELRSFLSDFLPDYMIPSVFMPLEGIPLTNNGKVNRRALPTPIMIMSRTEHVAPENSVEHDIRSIWSKLLDIPEEKISVTDNYFQLGGNSLSVTSMCSQIESKMSLTLPISKVFNSPTIRSIRGIIVEGCLGSETLHIERIKNLIEEDLVLPENIQPLKVINNNTFTPKRIFVTGATGYLGAYLVNELCKRGNSEIVCLVRAEDSDTAHKKLMQGFRDNQLPQLTKAENITAVCGDFERPYFGLDCDTYKDLANTIDVIYHNGALVHHLYDYERMRCANVLSTLQLIKFSTESINKAIHFISTIGVLGIDVQQKIKSRDTDWSLQNLNGYLLTKWVSEQLLIQAQQRGIEARIYRPGNITGHSKTGFCAAEKNHTLLRVKGFIQLGKAYYNDHEFVEMTPVDLLSQDIVNKSLSMQKHTSYNLFNPSKIRMRDYVSTFVNNRYKVDRITEHSHWLETMRQLDKENALYLVRAFYELDESNKVVPIEDEGAITTDLSIPLPSNSTLIHHQVSYLNNSGFLPAVIDVTV